MNKHTLFATGIILLFCNHVFCQEDTADFSCTDCHSDMVEHEVMHYPAEDDCENCHMSNGNEHPNDSLRGFDLGDEMPGLCFLCHEEHTKENKHAVSEMGECLMCHSAHGS
ncbi:MAG: cytochrome c3 family protein, partial [Bacteroidota bacterium]